MPAAALPDPPAAARNARLWRAGGWLLGSSAASQALRLASSLLLTRLLQPAAFGLMSAVQAMYFALVMFSDLGVWQSVVKRPGRLDERFLGTAMAVQGLRALLLCVAVLGIALGVRLAAAAGLFSAGTVYADARLPAMLAAFGLAALLQGLESQALAVAQRELRTGDLARLELASQLAGALVTWSLAAATASVWSLVAGTLAATATRTLLSHRLDGPRVRPCWDRACAGDIAGFGRWILLSSVVGFAAAQGEKVLLGALLDAAAFGVYAIAATLLAALTGVLGMVNAHLVFPGFSEALRADDARAAVAYRRVQRGADRVLGAVAGGAFAAGGWVVHWLYDPRYADAGWILQVLALGLLAARFQVLEQWMFARSQPAWVTGNNALRACALALAVPIGHALGGVHGAAIGVAASQFASWPLALAFQRRHGLLRLGEERHWIAAFFAGLAACAVADAALRHLFMH